MVNIKWSSEWTNKIKLIKKKDIPVQKLIDEAKPLIATKDKLIQEINDLAIKIQKETGNYPSFVYLRKWIDNWNNNRGGHNYQNLSDAFHKSGVNQYRFDEKIKNWYKKTYGTDTAYKNNLYRATLNGSNYEITEEELLTLMARVVKALEEVDLNNFTTEFKKVQTNSTIQTSVQTWLTEIKNEAKLIKIGSDKVSRKSYDFPETYSQKFDNNTAYAGKRIYSQFFEFIKEVKAKESFLDKLDSDKQKKVPQSENYQIFLKGDKYDPKKLKEDYNIFIDENSQELYKTGNNSINFSVNQGIKDWIDLASTVAFDDNKEKLLSSLTRSDNPNWELLDDLLKSVNANTANLRDKDHPNHPQTFQKGGHNYGLDTFPKSLEEFENLLDKAESQRNLANVKVVKWEDDLLSKNKELTEKEVELNKIETQLDDLLKEELTNLRTEVKSKGIEPGKTFSLENDNRKTLTELNSLKTLLENIRFLEKGDEEQETTISEENSAYETLKTLLDEYKNSQIILWKDLAGKTDTEKIKKLKEDNQKLDPWFNEFEKWDKKIKFTAEQEASFKAIKVELGKEKDESEELSDWKVKLKELNPLLETVITEEVMRDWQTQNNFKTLPKMEEELKKIFTSDKKLDEGFAKLIKKEDAEITDIAKLFTKKKAKEIITLIEFYEFDRKTDEEKTALKQKIWWTLEKKDPENDNKYLASGEPTETEIRDILYEVAIGNKTLRTQKKEDETQEPPSPKKNDEENKMSSMKKWFGFGSMGKSLLTYGGILVVIGGVLAVVFWDKIKGWWDGPTKEEETPEEEEKEADIE